VAVSCEHSSINGEEFIGQLNDYQIIKKDSILPMLPKRQCWITLVINSIILTDKISLRIYPVTPLDL
jgi:hypothetical protein